MLRVGDLSVLVDCEEAEKATPSVQKVIDAQRTICASRPFRHPKDFAFGPPVLCDFGEARIGSCHQYLGIQPEVYKAPEILMQTDWCHSVDIWNLACVVSSPVSPCLLMLTGYSVGMGHGGG